MNIKPLLKRLMLCICPAVMVPLGAMAQQTVFFDNFATSTINLPSTNNGSATASYTSYDIASGKSVTSTTIAPGHLGLECASTSAGYMEAQAVFTAYPVTLATVGDSIDVQVVFTDTTNFFNNNAANSESFGVGLYNSGGSLPYCVQLNGTNLWNSGLSGSLTYANSGGVQNWVGYRGLIAYNPGGTANSVVQTRPTQNQGDNQNQVLMQSGGGGFANATTVASQVNSWVGLTLTIGSQYTVDYNISIISTNPLTLAFTNVLYAGVGTSGTIIATNGGTNATIANILTTNFDSFAIGGERTGSKQSTNDINQITITATLTAQAGPYFVVSGSGGCGAQLISLSGSVTTNVYWLYTNGVNTGISVPGTGSPISLGIQTVPAVYTVIASNTVTTSQGPMWGSVAITQGPPIFQNMPASVICATNSIATFSASASGNGVSYQWFRNNVPLSNGGDVSGAQTTNLVISPAQTADTGSYYLVVTNTCGYSVTTSPNATLTLEKPYNLVWAGNNPNDNWDLATTPNFLNGPNSQDYTNGDDVTFNDSSANTSVLFTGNTIAPTLVTVTGTQNYTFGGSGSIVGAASVLVSGSATLTLTNVNNYNGGTIITNSASLDVGNGALAGKLTGNIVVNSGSTLHYLPANADTTLQHNNVSGNGTILYDFNGNSHTIALDPSMTNSSFQGTMEIKAGCRLMVTTAYGLGGTNILVDFDPNTPLSASLYANNASVTNSEPISITGRGPGSPVDTPYGFGALRLNGGWSGPITIAGVDPTYGYTMIGAASGTGTIIGPITDNGNQYELCYYGGTIRVGPTNGVQNIYGVTRISEQLNNPNISQPTFVIALNSNAFSTNTLNMNGQAYLELNGNNLQFDNLIDESLTYATSNYLSVIENNNTNAPAVITVGQDNNSSIFYGIFANGTNSQPLGVTKAGTGTLILTGDSTNTGPVTISAGTLQLAPPGVNYPNNQPVPGSGSFSNAALIAVSSGAVLNVSSRNDGTLTLNGGQTLKGSGTVQGNVIANTGSTIFPGDTIGTLNVSGNATLNGTLLIGLNRAGTPNCSKLAAGSITYGGTLATTNLGAVLHVGDSFQLFPGATSGFAAVNLQTNDFVNNVKYTWNNTISTDGKITVGAVSLLVNTSPTNIVASVSNNNLILSWPADHIGWTLQVQTNSLNVGISNNWVTIPGSTSVNSVTNAMNTGNGTVFYRLFYHP